MFSQIVGANERYVDNYQRSGVGQTDTKVNVPDGIRHSTGPRKFHLFYKIILSRRGVTSVRDLSKRDIHGSSNTSNRFNGAQPSKRARQGSEKGNSETRHGGGARRGQREDDAERWLSHPKEIYERERRRKEGGRGVEEGEKKK